MQLSKSLDKFVCSSMADAMRLRDLCRRNRIDLRRVDISAVNFDLPQHNISPERQPDPSLTTIYKVLKGEHAVVINVLVDVEKIEQVVLMPEENADAKDVAFGRRRRNVKTVVCGNGTRMEMKGASEVMRPFGGRLQAKIGADQGALIAETRAALEAAKAKLAQACAAAESSKREYGGMQQQVRAAKLERKKAADAVTLAEAKLLATFRVEREYGTLANRIECVTAWVFLLDYVPRRGSHLAERGRAVGSLEKHRGVVRS